MLILLKSSRSLLHIVTFWLIPSLNEKLINNIVLCGHIRKEIDQHKDELK